MTLKVDDILHFLVARTSAPSSMGAQLERMKNGCSTAPDPFRARDEAESAMLEQANLLRAMDEFEKRDEFRSSNRNDYRKLHEAQRKCATSGRIPQGKIALGVLRAYQERATTSQERGLVEVYRFVRSIAPKSMPPPPKDEGDLAQAFRTGKASRSRDDAAEIYADALLALGTFLQSWNKRRR